MINALLAAAAVLSLAACASNPAQDDRAGEQASYTTGSNIARRDKGAVQNAERYKKDPVTEAMGEDYGKNPVTYSK
ncbi:hypothetical protein H5407_09005 [Mitsuaria sp. WAJ17]|uniref:hypothetical protein n=1 Tax=Mitsuaria sp. WAJ17 TaxID=2761452 RepID=UPI001604414E|nr:hypothetical protein [Mitsuaria sp. WAJ17]MBB2485364.1 hypothetical protein [Mitsuaria sp. WAJ17]